MSKADDDFNSGALFVFFVFLACLFEGIIIYFTYDTTRHAIWNEAVKHGYAVKIKTSEGESFIWKNNKGKESDGN